MVEPTQEDFKKLTKAIEDLTQLYGNRRGLGGGGSSSRSRSSRPGSSSGSSGNHPDLDDRIREMQNELKDAQKGIKKLTQGSSLLAAATIKTTNLLSNNQQIVFFKDMLKKSGEMLKDDVNPNFIALARRLNLLKDDVDSLKDGVIEFRDGLETADFVKLSMALAGTGDIVTKANGKAAKLIDVIEGKVDAAGKIKIAAIRASGGSAMAQAAKIKQDASFADQFAGIDGDNTLPQFAAGLEEIITTAKEQMLAQGVSADMLAASGDALIETFDKLGTEAARVNKVFEETAKAHTTVMAQIKKAGEDVTKSFHDLAKRTLAAAAALGAFDTIKANMSSTFGDMKAFNISNIADSFYNLQKQSIWLGMSFQDTMALYKENARLISVTGKDGFESQIKNLKGTFAEYGYTVAQGSKLIGPAFQNAVLSGVNVSNQDEMTAYMKQSLKNTQLMSAITGKAPEAIMAVHKSVLESDNVFKSMLGMDKQRRAAYSKEITQTIDRLVLGGMEYEQAAEVVKLQQDAARAPVRKKFEEAAWGMMGSQMAGMSGAETHRLRNLELQTDWTDAEREEKVALQLKRSQGMEAGLRREQDRTGRNANMYLLRMQAIQDRMPKDQATVRAAGDALIKREAGIVPTDEQAARTAALAKGNETVANFGNKLESISALLNNTFLKSLVGSAVAIVALGASALQTIAAFKMLRSGAGGLGGTGLPDWSDGGPGGPATKPGKGGKGGGWKAGAGRFASKLASPRALSIGGFATVAGSIVADQYIDSQVEDKKMEPETAKKAKAGTAILGGAAGGALTGALVGSFVPFIGNAIGAALGGVIGAGIAAYEHRDTLLGSSDKAPTATSENAALAALAAAGVSVTGVAGAAAKVAAMPGVTGGASTAAGTAAIKSQMMGILSSPDPVKALNAVNIDTLAAESMQGFTGKLLTVSDKEANVNLQSIAASMTEAVELLRSMVTDESNTPMRRSTRKIPGAAEFVTGNG